ncbi:MAG: hypothetical protein WBO45_24650, partial [Planctomycetota bacterium]
VLGSGGRALAQAFGRWRSGQHRPVAAVAAFALAAVERVAATLRARLGPCAVVEFGGSCKLHAGRLGEAAGFGIVSPVSGLLLHPEFGPWVRVRGALLLRGHPFGEVADASLAETFHPCCGCPRPCLSACPASVSDGLGHHDLVRCASHRHGGGCIDECSTRRACPVGAQHRDSEADSHRHTYELASMRRWAGFGVWRFVPARWRGGPLREG